MHATVSRISGQTLRCFRHTTSCLPENPTQLRPHLRFSCGFSLAPGELTTLFLLTEIMANIFQPIFVAPLAFTFLYLEAVAVNLEVIGTHNEPKKTAQNRETSRFPLLRSSADAIRGFVRVLLFKVFGVIILLFFVPAIFVMIIGIPSGVIINFFFWILWLFTHLSLLVAAYGLIRVKNNVDKRSAKGKETNGYLKQIAFDAYLSLEPSQAFWVRSRPPPPDSFEYSSAEVHALPALTPELTSRSCVCYACESGWHIGQRLPTIPETKSTYGRI